MNEQGNGRTRQAPWIKIVLVVSLCFNLVIVGLAVGMALNWTRFGSVSIENFAGPAGLGGLVRSFDQRERLLLRQDIAGMSDVISDQRRRSSVNLDNIVTILRAGEFDREALEVLFSDQIDILNNRMEQSHKLLIDRIDKMTAEERNAFADRLSEHYHRNGKRGRKHHGR